MIPKVPSQNAYEDEQRPKDASDSSRIVRTVPAPSLFVSVTLILAALNTTGMFALPSFTRRIVHMVCPGLPAAVTGRK